METIIRLLQKKRKLKETLEQINNDSRYRNISFVCAGSLRKGSRNYMNRMTDKLCRTYDELERCKRAIKIVTGGYFGLDDVDSCRTDIMAYWPEYEANLTMYEPIVYYAVIIRKSFLKSTEPHWIIIRYVWTSIRPTVPYFGCIPITSFCTGRKTDLKNIFV